MSLTVNGPSDVGYMSSADHPEHPGTVEYIDGNTGRVVRTRDASELPEDRLWVHVEGRWVPIVRVVAKKYDDDHRVITELGPNNEVLRTTTQRRSE
jgi:hypothetical protein